MCVCVCERESERERERKSDKVRVRRYSGPAREVVDECKFLFWWFSKIE